MAERNGNKYVNGKDNYILRNKYIFFDGVWGPFKVFLKCGGVGNVLIED